jgi:ABC-type nitrate/sulfonate/bicarbonate transport system substrate-binding protein
MWGAGNIHLGTATATMVVPIAASGQLIYNIAPQSDVAGTQQIVLVKKGQEIVRSPKDFEKVKIGMPKGASVTMAIQAMARDTGVDFAKLQFVNLSPPDAVTALAKGDIDAMAGWAPWVFNAVKQGGGKVYFTGNRSFIPGKEGQVDWLHVHAGVVASGKMLKENPNTLKAVLRALRKATDTINTDREAAVKIVARETKTDEALTRDIMALNIYSMEMNDQSPKGMGEFMDFLHSLDRIKQKFRRRRDLRSSWRRLRPALVKWKSDQIKITSHREWGGNGRRLRRPSWLSVPTQAHPGACRHTVRAISRWLHHQQLCCLQASGHRTFRSVKRPTPVVVSAVVEKSYYTICRNSLEERDMSRYGTVERAPTATSASETATPRPAPR